MKKIIVIIALMSLPFATIAQSEMTMSVDKLEKRSDNDRVESKSTPKKEALKRSTNFLKLNYKKSNDIISIKAYRKSLNVKVRTKKFC